MIDDPKATALRAGTWEQYKAQLPYVVLNGVRWPYVTFGATLRIPAIVFDDTAKALRTGWTPAGPPWTSGTIITLYGWWGGREYMLTPFQFKSAGVRVTQSYISGSTPLVEDITGLNKDTWLDKVGMAGALAAVSAGFGSVLSAGVGVAVTGTAATAADVTAAAEVSFAGNAVVSTAQAGFGNQDSAAAFKVAGLLSGQLKSGGVLDSAGSSVADTGNTQMFDDIDITNASPFDGFNFSSGEAVPAFSDFQNVSYGFPSDTTDFLNPDSVGFLPGNVYQIGTPYDTSFDIGQTPDVTSNTFGTTFNAAPDTSDAINVGKAASAAVPLAQAGAAISGATKAQTGQVAGNTAKPTTGSNDVLSTFGNVISAIDSGARAIAGGTPAQRTTAQQVSYTGQLTPNGGSAVGLAGVPTNTLLLIGGAILVLALAMHME